MKLTQAQLAKYMDHTMLKPEATPEMIDKTVEEARKYNTASVCINPYWVKRVHEGLEGTDINTCTVIGFPLGATSTESKVFETKQAIEDGADEIDMVINDTKVKDHDTDFIVEEIKLIKAACGGHNLKVILETDLLNQDEIKYACECAIKGGADFVKTSTGFVKGGVGAKVEDVELMYNTVKDAGLQVKASGGIRDKEKALQMIKAGAVRLGTSSGVKIIA